MSIELTFEEAVALLKRAVEEKGEDYVYLDEDGKPATNTSCAYFYDEGKEPACIVGHVLAYKGVTRDDLMVSVTCDLNFESGVDELRTWSLVALDPRTQTLLNRAQKMQDKGGTWGSALRYALEAADATG